MKRKLTRISLAFLAVVCIWGCNSKSTNKVQRDSQQNYSRYKQSFEPWLVNHFPELLTGERSMAINSKNVSKNSIGLYLYEYDVELSILQNLKQRLKNNSIAHYSTDNPMLLIVNRFETMKSYEDREIPLLTDSTYLDSRLYTNLYPVPNFINYENPKQNNGIWLPEGFDLYVLDAKSGSCCKEFGLNTNFQMPEGWKNGFSRGVAISEKNKTVVYWGIIW